MTDSNRIGWMVVSAGTTMLTRKAVGKLLDTGWRAAAGDDPPPRRANGRGAWLPALGWAMGAAAVMAAAEFGAREGAAALWHRWTGEDPPED